jgi:prophage antirepressor-like protein
MSQSAIADFEIRVIRRDGEPWFVLNDVCHVLGLTSPHVAARKLRESEKGWYPIPTLGGPQETAVISEHRLYRLVMRSDKQEARSFQDWVVGEVLPSVSAEAGSHAGRSRRL